MTADRPATRPARVSGRLTRMVSLVPLLFLAGGLGRAESPQAPCGRGDARQDAVCASILRHLHWSWTGHGAFSPGRRASHETYVAVYCEQHLRAEDAARLRALAAESSDRRIRTAAEDLHALLTGHYVFGAPVPDNNAFSRNHPGYLLRNGCAKTP